MHDDHGHDGCREHHAHPPSPSIVWTSPSISRRDFFRRASGGFASLALAGMLAETAKSDRPMAAATADPLAPKPGHFPARAKHVIWLFMPGGVSHVDSFDPKPALTRDHGKKIGKRIVTKPLWEFRPRGESGIEISDLFPHVAERADDLCVIRSMNSSHGNHFEATLAMHTGSTSFAMPSVGAWMSYGLGTINQNLPSFVVLAPKYPYAGEQVWDSNFLPGCHRGVRFVPGDNPVANLDPRVPSSDLQRLELDMLGRVNREHQEPRASNRDLESRIRSFEMAFAMQREAPDAFDLSGESDDTLAMYGLERGKNQGFGWQCLMARRLVERGVRFVELIDVGASGNWDDHGNMERHGRLARNIDRPIAGLLDDLKRRGLLEDTLMVWTTEFGRTPTAKPDALKGRDHHPAAFSTWLAGGGVKGGFVHGETDELGNKVARDRVHVHDLHATILHLMGLDHERLTYRHAGRDFRLTDVHGNVIRDLLA